MGIYAITGSATGIGACLRERLQQQGHKVVGIDIQQSDIVADLSTAEGRQQVVEQLQQRCPEGLDGFIPCAGLGPTVENLPLIIAVNFFASRYLAEQLLPLLAKKQGRLVLISSNSSTLPGLKGELIEAMRDDYDEEKAKALIATMDGHQAYAGSKFALTCWMRRAAPEFAGSGVLMNAVAPGATMTPLLQQGLDDPNYGPAIEGFKGPTGKFGTPQQIAGAIEFLLSESAAFCCGTVLFIDGGMDAQLRPDAF